MKPPPHIPATSPEWDGKSAARNPRAAGRTYLTPEAAAAAPAGTVWDLGYDDFNKGHFTFTVIGPKPSREGEVRIEGMTDFGDGAPFPSVIYQLGSTMCSGSGGERLFLRRSRVAKPGPHLAP